MASRHTAWVSDLGPTLSLNSLFKWRRPSLRLGWVLAVCLSAGVAPPLVAQSPPPMPAASAAQTLPELMLQLLQDHPLMRARRAESEATLQGMEIARRQHWPTPSFSTDYGPRTAGNNKDLARASVARLSLPLFTGGLLTADEEAAAMRYQISRLDMQSQGQELGLQWLDLYRGWWQQQHRLRTIDRSLARMRDLHQMIERRTDAGVSAEVEQQLTQVQINRLLDERSLAQRLSEQVLADMANLLGQPVRPPMLDVAQLPLKPWARLEDMTERSLGISPAVLQSRQNVELAKVEQKRVRAGLMPTVQLRFERQWGTYYGQQPAGERVYVNTQAAFGAGLSALQQQQQALSRTEAAEQQVGAVRQRVQSLANRVWHEELAAQSQLDNASELSRAYDDLESSSLRLFTAGRRTWQELMNLQRERHQLFMQQSDAQSALFGARLRMLWLADVFPGVQLTDHPQPPLPLVQVTPVPTGSRAQ